MASISAGEQVFLVLVVMDCGRLEIAAGWPPRSARWRRAAMLEQMPGQPAERRTDGRCGHDRPTAGPGAGRVRAQAPARRENSRPWRSHNHAGLSSAACGFTPPQADRIQARPANPACSTGSSASTGNCRAGLPSTMTRNSPTSACAAIGATSGSRGHTGSTLAPAGTVTYRSRAKPAFSCRPGLSRLRHGHGLALGVELTVEPLEAPFQQLAAFLVRCFSDSRPPPP